MNINPILMCARCGAAILHIFVDRRPQRRQAGELAYVDFIFRCDRCGTVRPWGNEARAETANGRKLADAALAHAIDKHGLRRQRCPSCRGASLDCTECGDEGEVWLFDSLDSCGPRCLIAGPRQPVNE